MTIEPAYSFVLWAIPRFHRAGAAKSERPPGDAQPPDRLAGNTAANAAHEPTPRRAAIETPRSRRLPCARIR